jgi:restriction endonuclease S subunit
MGKNIGPGYLKLKSLDRVRNDFHLKNRKSQLKAGDIVVVRIGNSGQAAQIPVDFGEANCAGLVIIKKPNSLINPSYLVYYLNSPQGRAYSLSKATGTTRQTLNTRSVAETIVPIPALEKQSEIVEKLDSAFAEIDLVERNLGLSDEKVKQLLQSLLSAAFTSPEDSFEPSNLSSNPGITMKMVSLKDISTFFGDGDWIESKDQSESGIRLIQTGNVGGGVFKDRLEKARWISEETFKRLRCAEIREGDVLISRLPDPVGRACLLPALEHKAITVVDCSIVRFDEKIMDPRYFVYYSQSSEYASSIEPLVSGSTRQRISREKLGTIQIPIPALEKQYEIIEKIDIVFAEIDLLKAQFKIKKDHAATLRQALLKNAFTQEEAIV